MEKRILLAEDSPSIRKFITFALAAKGYKIISAADGMEALEKLAHEKVGLIITDLNMPNIDGFELIKTIRSNIEYNDVPIIILSSLSGSEDCERGIMYGASSYIIKPSDPKRILYEVSKYLN